MIKQKLAGSLLVIAMLIGCQGTGESPTQPPSPSVEQASPLPTLLEDTPVPLSSPTSKAIPPTSTATTVSVPTSQPLPAFTIDWSKPFAPMQIMGIEISLTDWQPHSYTGEEIPLPLDLDQVVNLRVLDGLTSDQRAFLATNGFVIVHSQEAQFGDIRVATAEKTGQPYYLTTDTAFHALHLLFDDLLKALEREYFLPQMLQITQTTLDQVREIYPQTYGTSIEADAKQALAYLSVALKLFNPQAAVDPTVEELVNGQIDQIMAAKGRSDSLIFPDFEDDYSAYLPVGHYAGDAQLEAYYRGMTWLGRMHFPLQDFENLDFIPSRLPLIITLAMRSAEWQSQPISDLWSDVHKTLTFIIGPSDDAGPLEYAALMDQVYGTSPTIQDLADESLWQDFLSKTDQLPSPEINSLFIASTVDLSPQKGWRFMGQRFTLDGMIMQNVVFDKVEPMSDGTKRDLPSGLDVMSALGSLPAFQELDLQGITRFPNYPQKVNELRQAVHDQPQQQWLARFYDTWLYSFQAILQNKDTSYPPYMQTVAWSYKDMNTALGSWAELKHDTILYSKMPETAAGGGPPMSEPAPSYVEPNPQAFYRMAYMAISLSCGLQDLILHEPCYLEDYYYGDLGLPTYIKAMGSLGSRFQTFGDIAAQELAGLPLDEIERYSITSCLGMIECMYTDTGYNQPAGEMPKVPVIAAVAGADNSILSVGLGNVDRIYVVIPLEGNLEIAQGGVFSYYEFTQLRAERLTDQAWQDLLSAGQVSLPTWADSFILPGGQPNETLFFRQGDVYFISIAGDRLNIREQPSTNAMVLTQVETGTYLEIVDGPVMADGYTWWKFSLFDWSGDAPIEGWAVENPEWYIRSYRPDQPQE